MRVVPAIVSSNTRSGAELRVFKAFQEARASGQAACFHSLRLAKHEYKREGELDFVFVGPQGLYVFEVKGGGVARNADGIWQFTDRFGERHRRSEGPVDQARSGLYSLRKWLVGQLGAHEVRQLAFGHGVIFPDCTFDVTSAEWPQEIILDGPRFQTQADFDRYLARVIQYWQQKSNRQSGAPTELVRNVEQLLRPRFDRVPNLFQRAREVDQITESLTVEQYEKLDAIEANPRILCSGGAGTGKTFLAAEIARRHAAQGDSVLLVCRSEVLAAYLRSRVAMCGVTVESFDGSLLRAPTDLPPCDVLIVDEAQDLMTLAHLVRLEALVKNGFADGRWRIFYDGNNQGAIFGTWEPGALELLRSYGAAEMHLKRNCRNTLAIVLQTRLITAADLGMPGAGAGPPVVYLYAAGERSTANLLAQEIRRLMAEEVTPGDIAILSPVPWAQSSARLLPSDLRSCISVLDEATAVAFPLRSMTFSQIVDFKGLESAFVIVVDTAGLEINDARGVSLLYVAMSRARAGLTLIVDEAIRQPLTELMAANLARVQPDLRQS